MEQLNNRILDLLSAVGLDLKLVEKCYEYLKGDLKEEELFDLLPTLHINYPHDNTVEEIFKALENSRNEALTGKYLKLIVEIGKQAISRVLYWCAGYGVDNVGKLLNKYGVNQIYFLCYTADNCGEQGFSLHTDTLKYFDELYDKNLEIFLEAYKRCGVGGKVCIATYIVRKDPIKHQENRKWLEEFLKSSIPNLFSNFRISQTVVVKMNDYIRGLPGIEDKEIGKLFHGADFSQMNRNILKMMLGASYMIEDISETAKRIIKLFILVDYHRAFDTLNSVRTSILLYDKSADKEFTHLRTLTESLGLPLEYYIAWKGTKASEYSPDYKVKLIEEMTCDINRYERAVKASTGLGCIYLSHLLWEKGLGKDYVKLCEEIYETLFYGMFEQLGTDRETVKEYMLYLSGDKNFSEVETLAKKIPVERISSNDLFKGLFWMLDVSEMPKRCFKLIANNEDVTFFTCQLRNYLSIHSASVIEYIKLLESFEIDMTIILPFIGYCISDGYNQKCKEALPEIEAYLRQHAEEVAKHLHLCDSAVREIILEVLFDVDQKKFLPTVLQNLGDSSKAVRMKAVKLLAGYQEAFNDVCGLLKDKKQVFRESAVLVLGEWKDTESLNILSDFYKVEKSDKIKNLISGIIKTSSNLTINQDTDILQHCKDALKNIKSTAYGWINFDALPKVRCKDSDQYCEEEIVKYIIVSYSVINSISFNYEAKKISEHLKDKDMADIAFYILNLWIENGAEAKKKWVLPLAAIHGDDRVVMLLKKKIEEWPEHARGAIACDAVTALAINDSDMALMTVDNLSRKFKFKQVKEAAGRAFGIAAIELGIDPEELSDRIVPNLDFDKNGERIFDYGSRKFYVRLTSKLDLEIFDENEKKIKSLPAPGKSDDAEKAKDASETFKNLKKHLKSVIEIQKVRLETALATNRKWTKPAWEKLFVENPIMQQFAFSLIWGSYHGDELKYTFRYMEDGTYNSKDEEEVSIVDGVLIGIVHPIELNADALEDWRKQLEDYEVDQPFEQLTRKVFRVEKEEEEAKIIERFGGKILNGYSLLGKIMKFGWYRGSIQDAGGYFTFYKENPKLGIGAELHFSGMSVGCENEDITIHEVIFFKAGTVVRGSYVYDTVKDEDLIRPCEVPERFFSEILYDVDRSTAGSTGTEVNWKMKR